MYTEDLKKVTHSGKGKVALLEQNPIGYFVSSVLAGIYVGLGILLIFTIGGILTGAGSSFTKIIMGVSFGIALSLVIIGGAELFTGNNFVMTVASATKEVSWGKSIKVWIVSYCGNLVGSILTGYGYYLTGLATEDVSNFIVSTTAGKMSIPVIELFFRGVFCNLLVCLAIWCAFRCQNEVAKLIMIFWCLYAFITTGYEHSIANMTLLTVGLLLNTQADISVVGYIYNIGIVTLGNMVGGIIVLGLPVYWVARKK